MPRKTSNSQKALQVRKDLDDEASAARSAAKAALRRAEVTKEIARRKRLELTPSTPAPKKATFRQQDVRACLTATRTRSSPPGSRAPCSSPSSPRSKL